MRSHKAEPARPKPEDLLERYGFAMRREERRRGKLRIFLGAAPGVGKSYAMLREGHRLKAEGHDVVIGLVETHGRADTAAQIGDLEIIPLLTIPYRGVTVAEMDTAAILRRKPRIVLVDELAHTNAPGSPHEKRFEEVERLRDAGIDVLATLNIQHLESLNSIVESITGVRVRETVPDRVLDDATEVQLVDLPVEGLIERLERGKVYPSEQARQALDHFFREGNLTALRELALRRTAAGVDERLEDYMREHGIDEVWPAAERVLVLIDEHPDVGTVVRHAWRLASALHGELVGVVVVPPGGIDSLSRERRAALDRAQHLAEDLGSEVKVVAGQHVASALADEVRAENATILVIGHAPESRWQRLRRPPMVDRLLRLVDGVGIHIVELADETRQRPDR